MQRAGMGGTSGISHQEKIATVEEVRDRGRPKRRKNMICWKKPEGHTERNFIKLSSKR